jgi:hypothetical protein
MTDKPYVKRFISCEAFVKTRDRGPSQAPSGLPVSFIGPAIRETPGFHLTHLSAADEVRMDEG